MGLFVTFEGIDGAGKTTQIKLLEEKLACHGIPALFVREPGSTDIGEKIRKILLSPESREMSITTEILLYAAARAQLVREKIKPGLAENRIVVCDRYIDSTFAYQGYGSGYNTGSIQTINREAADGEWPDLTFILDISVSESLKRRRQKSGAAGPEDRIEQRDSAYYNRVRNGYLSLAGTNKERVTVIPDNLSIDDAHNIIWERIHGRIVHGL